LLLVILIVVVVLACGGGYYGHGRWYNVPPQPGVIGQPAVQQAPYQYPPWVLPGGGLIGVLIIVLLILFLAGRT
jgi:hypothetical protein